MVADPQFPRVRVQGRPLRVAVSQAPDLWLGAGLRPAGVARRCRAIGRDAHHLAIAAAQILGKDALLVRETLPQRDDELA
jgi:hypothetical protein